MNEFRKLQMEFATLTEAIEEDAVIIHQLQQEIEQYKKQEAYLLERIKRLESKLPESGPKYSDADDQY